MLCSYDHAFHEDTDHFVHGRKTASVQGTETTTRYVLANAYRSPIALPRTPQYSLYSLFRPRFAVVLGLDAVFTTSFSLIAPLTAFTGSSSITAVETVAGLCSCLA